MSAPPTPEELRRDAGARERDRTWDPVGRWLEQLIALEHRPNNLRPPSTLGCVLLANLDVRIAACSDDRWTERDIVASVLLLAGPREALALWDSLDPGPPEAVRGRPASPLPAFVALVDLSDDEDRRR